MPGEALFERQKGSQQTEGRGLLLLETAGREAVVKSSMSLGSYWA